MKLDWNAPSIKVIDMKAVQHGITGTFDEGATAGGNGGGTINNQS